MGQCDAPKAIKYGPQKKSIKKRKNCAIFVFGKTKKKKRNKWRGGFCYEPIVWNESDVAIKIEHPNIIVLINR